MAINWVKILIFPSFKPKFDDVTVTLSFIVINFLGNVYYLTPFQIMLRLNDIFMIRKIAQFFPMGEGDGCHPLSPSLSRILRPISISNLTNFPWKHEPTAQKLVWNEISSHSHSYEPTAQKLVWNEISSHSHSYEPTAQKLVWNEISSHPHLYEPTAQKFVWNEISSHSEG